MDPTLFGGADFGMCNVGDQPQNYLLSSRYLVPRSGIQDDMPKPELQQSERGPDGPPKATEEDFKKLKRLGMGGYGKVILVRKKKEEHKKKYFAMKVFEKPKGYQSAKREKEGLMKCKHPFIVSLFYAFQTASKFCLVLEYAPGGDLATYIRRHNVQEDHARFYSSEIILAIEYLHGLSILHRDLKPDNVLICADGHIKLADFGLSKQLRKQSSTTYTICGTKGYKAPEIIDEDSTGCTYGKAVDWWSMGALMYRMLLGKRPFNRVVDHDDSDYLKHVKTVHLKDDWEFAFTLPMTAQDLIEQLLAVNPVDRLGGGPDDAVPIKNHKFFRSINWGDVLQKRYKPPYKVNLKSETDTSAFDPKVHRQNFDDDCNDSNFEGFSYVAPSSFDGLPEKSGSSQGQQPRPSQAPSRSISHCPTEAIHQIQVVRDHTASSPRFDAHQQATAYPAMSNTPQILPSNLSYNSHISDPVEESDRLSFARMDYTPIAPMFSHHNLVPPPPGFNMVQNPPPEYYNTQQILPSNLSYNPPISDPVEESFGQRYARMDYTQVASMFGHHNLVRPRPPGLHIVRNPPPHYYNASTGGPCPCWIPEPGWKFTHTCRGTINLLF